MAEVGICDICGKKFALKDVGTNIDDEDINDMCIGCTQWHTWTKVDIWSDAKEKLRKAIEAKKLEMRGVAL